MAAKAAIGLKGLKYARKLLVQTCCCTQKKRRFWSIDSSTGKSLNRQVGVANFTRKPSLVVQVDLTY